MTTITIKDSVQLEQTTFNNIEQLLDYLILNFLNLTELSNEEVSPELFKKAQQAEQDYLQNPSSFKRI